MKLMETKKILSKTIGVIAMIFAFLAFYNIFGIQTMLSISSESIGLYLWTFIILGMLSIISGLFLFYEK